jgi:hypothetical protein
VDAEMSDEVLTRKGLLTLLAERGFPMSERSLQLLAAEGRMPRPIRRWRDGAPRAAYNREEVETAITSLSETHCPSCGQRIRSRSRRR